MKRITLRIGLSCILCSLALLSCGQWNYKFCNPYDPDAEYDVVYSGGSIASHTVASSEKWSGAVTITGNITVPVGCVLYLEPGTIAMFQTNTSNPIEVFCYGSLFAVGTASSPIVIRSSDGSSSGAWGCIRAQGMITIDYCVVQDAAWGLYLYGPLKGSLKHTYFNNCSNPALMTDLSDAASFVAKNLTFDSCPRGWYNKTSRTMSYAVFTGCGEAVFLDYYATGTTILNSCNFTTSTLGDVSIYVDNSSSAIPAVQAVNCFPEVLTGYLWYSQTATQGTYTPAVSSASSSTVLEAGCGFDYLPYKR